MHTMALIYALVGQLMLFKRYFHVNALFYVIYHKNLRYSHMSLYKAGYVISLDSEKKVGSVGSCW